MSFVGNRTHSTFKKNVGFVGFYFCMGFSCKWVFFGFFGFLYFGIRWENITVVFGFVVGRARRRSEKGGGCEVVL